jgi:glycosyltransferase involved in cell wall biosynthesis
MVPTVLHVTQTTIAGVARCVLDLATDQAGRGWQVAVASPEADGFVPSVISAGAAHYVWPAARRPGVSALAEFRPLAEIINRASPDVVHLHSSKAGLVGRVVVRDRLPTLFQPHGWSFLAVGGLERQTAQAWERFAARWTTALVCVSEREKRDGVAAGIRAPWQVVPNAVDLRRFRPSDEAARHDSRRRLGLDNSPLAVCVARLTHQKAQDVLLAAWPAIRASVPTATLVLVGDVFVGGGLDRERLERLATDGVSFVGPRADIPDWMTAADVVVVPSRWEGMSYVVLEAMASGRSVVASDVGGAHEALGEEDGRAAGGLVPPEDAAALAGAVIARFRDPERARAEGDEGAARARSRHDLVRWCDLMADITLASLTTGGRHRGSRRRVAS